MFKYTLLLISLSFFIFTSVVYSQTKDPDTPIQTVSLEQLKRDYFFQVEKYHEAEEKFNFERAEFKKLDTLASQEDAIAAMKQLMIARAITLRSYLATVERQVYDANNIDSSIKTDALQKLQQAQLKLKTHEEEVPNLFDKNNVLSTSREFETEIDSIFEAQYRGLALISINRVQSALDNLVEVSNQFENQIITQIQDESFKAANIRGLKEVSEQINIARESLETANNTYKTFSEEEKSNKFRQIYSTCIADLGPAHTSSQRAIDFLIELERGL